MPASPLDRRRVRRGMTIGWPREEPAPGTHFWADQVLSGLRANGVRVEKREVLDQPGGFLLLAEVDFGGERYAIVFDPDDRPEIIEDVADRALVYFKLQYADDGYSKASVVSGGYLLANNVAYRYLPLLRAIRSSRRFSYDVYGRFGLRYGGEEIRRRAVEILAARRDFQFEGSLFKYPGGPEKTPYRRYLFEIARAKVCVDMPGAGDLCTRLIDYLAVGVCVVGPAPKVRLPVELVDGVHIVYCASDLSDLADTCAQLVRDDGTRERIARNARDFFDRHLHRRRLGAYYAERITDALVLRIDPRPAPTASLASGR